MVAVASFVVRSGQTRLPLYVSVLAVLGANRFFLAALRGRYAARRRPDNLVMANSVAPTAARSSGSWAVLAGSACGSR